MEFRFKKPPDFKGKHTITCLLILIIFILILLTFYEKEILEIINAL